MKRASFLFLAAILTFAVGLIVNSLSVKPKARFKTFPSEPPIAFQSTKQNKGTRCRPIYYGQGMGDGFYDPYCFDLEEKLAQAAWDGDSEKIKDLLRSGANANSQAGDGSYPLEAAAREGHLDAARLLLDNGADVNHWHPIHGTPLLSAVDGGQAETVELLLSRGAKTELASDGVTPLKLAQAKKNQAIISLLKRAGAEK